MRPCSLFIAWGWRAVALVAIPLSCLSFWACSGKYLSRRGEGQEVATRHLQALCFTGEGRGQIRRQGRSYHFAYESLLERGSWELGVNLPWQNTYTLKLRELSGGRGIRGEGELARWLEKPLRGQGHQRVEALFQHMGQWARVVRKARRGEAWGKCGWRGSELLACEAGEGDSLLALAWSWSKSGKVALRVGPGRKDSLGVGLSQFDGQYFNRLALHVPSNAWGPQLQVELSLEHCSQSLLEAQALPGSLVAQGSVLKGDGNALRHVNLGR